MTITKKTKNKADFKQPQNGMTIKWTKKQNDESWKIQKI